MNVNSTISIIVDFASGQTIFLKIAKCPAPSLFALSIISLGIDRKKLRIKSILYTPVQPGSISQK